MFLEDTFNSHTPIALQSKTAHSRCLVQKTKQPRITQINNQKSRQIIYLKDKLFFKQSEFFH